MATDYPLRAMLVLAALLGSAFAYPERSRPRAADTLLQERRLCYYDDILLSFVHWSVDSVPICSSLLGIQDLTSTLPSATSRTACSCLNLSPQTVSSQATVQTTRTITARVEATEAAVTVTSGTFTSIVTATVIPLPFFPTANLTADISSFYPSTATGPINSAGTSLLYPTLTSIPYPRINTTYTYDPPTLTLASTTLTAEDPFATSVGKGGCPSVNNTIYTLPTGQQYQIQCYRTYGGAVSIGIDAPQLVDCMQQCSMANSGFSAIRCFGVSWMSYPTTGLHCNLKSQNALSIFTANFFAASAVLLTGVPPPPVGVFDSGTAGDSSVGGQLPDDDPGTWRRGRVLP
ncbi:MAG: hypothetical protein LQ352_007709 [Teloschistes flavicans]|nr:MAG: hypothetical protein LQ352_007709 [Teloschistes flavicans]